MSAMDEVLALREELASKTGLLSQPIGDIALVLVVDRLDKLVEQLIASNEKLEDVRRMLDLIDDRLAAIDATIREHR